MGEKYLKSNIIAKNNIEYQKKYYEKNKQKKNEYSRKYYMNNKEKYKKYYKKNNDTKIQEPPHNILIEKDDGRIKEDDYYIYYKDKIFSKCHFKELCIYKGRNNEQYSTLIKKAYNENDKKMILTPSNIKYYYYL